VLIATASPRTLQVLNGGAAATASSRTSCSICEFANHASGPEHTRACRDYVRQPGLTLQREADVQDECDASQHPLGGRMLGA
jgi:hypothetical protein